MYHIQTDTLGTPRTITNANDGSLVWSWDNSEAFGNNSNNNTGLEFNLRFSGQYFDEEKGSSYNINRDYASGLGRYIQSDPIGLNGGINTYGYVQANPMNAIDPEGLFTQIIVTDSYWNETDGGSFGHVAIQIDNQIFGFYPKPLFISKGLDLSSSFLRTGDLRKYSLNDFISTYENKNASSFVLNINKNKEQDLINYFNNLTSNTPKYNLIGRSLIGGENCSSVAANGTNQIIPNLNLNGFSPYSLENDLLKLYIKSNSLISEYRTGIIK